MGDMFQVDKEVLGLMLTPLDRLYCVRFDPSL